MSNNSSPYLSKLTGDYIRLLLVQPGEEDTEVHCTLVHSTLEGAVAYDALSYVWGNKHGCETIICDSQPVKVTQNLHSILREYRRRAELRPLWVDALCINQSDNEERTQQVRKMQSIYSKADKVIVWLGEEMPGDDLALDGLKGMSAPWAKFQGIPLFHVQDLAAYDMWLSMKMKEQTVAAMTAFLQRPWFSRIWIVQEVVSAAEVVIWCGSSVLDADTVLTGAAAMRKLHNMSTRMQLNTNNDSGLSRLKLSCGGDLEVLKRTQEARSGVGILTLLSLTRNFDSTEPRDKIFALVGLANDIESNFVDYSLDIRSVTIRLSKHLLLAPSSASDLSLALLSCITRSADEDLNALPSWVVDWKNLNESLFTPLRVSYPTQMPNQSQVSELHLAEDDVLHVEGTIIDQLKTDVPSPKSMQQIVTTKELNDLRNAQEMDTWHTHCLQSIVGITEYPTGESTYEAFWRSLMCNRKDITTTNKPENDKSYRAWIRLINAQMAVATKESYTDYIYKIGSLTILGLSALSAVITFRRAERWRAFALLSFIPLNYIGQLMWRTGRDLYKVQTKRNYFRDHISDQAEQREFESSFSSWSQGRKFGLTTQGYMGWVPMSAQSSDSIVMIKGFAIPFAMRRFRDGWKLLGDCYLHGRTDILPLKEDQTAIALKIY